MINLCIMTFHLENFKNYKYYYGSLENKKELLIKLFEEHNMLNKMTKILMI